MKIQPAMSTQGQSQIRGKSHWLSVELQSIFLEILSFLLEVRVSPISAVRWGQVISAARKNQGTRRDDKAADLKNKLYINVCIN